MNASIVKRDMCSQFICRKGAVNGNKIGFIYFFLLSINPWDETAKWQIADSLCRDACRFLW